MEQFNLNKRMLRVVEDLISTNEAKDIAKNKYNLELTDVADWIENQLKQKTSKYKIGDTIYFNSFNEIKSIVVSNIIDDGDGNPLYEDADGNSVFETHIIELKSVWSEEDEEKLNSITEVLSNDSLLVNWLNSLKNRVQPKQEWSEDDEDVINHLLAICAGAKRYRQFAGCLQDDITKYQNWLKSLKPNHWKPSEEQMKALKGLLDYNIGVYDYNQFQIVDSLYNDLKEL